jgi:hypothetical protein
MDERQLRRLGRSDGVRVDLTGPGVRQKTSAGPRTVSFSGDLVVKSQDSDASRRERLRTLAGRKVGQQTGLFVVPDIVSFNDASGQIVFERLPLIGLQGTLSDPNQSLEVVDRAAEALAAIHGHMEPSETATTIPTGAMGISPERELVPLHGDFGVTNVLHLESSDRIVIIDWSNAAWIRFNADLGAPEIDIAVFLMSLFHHRLFGSGSMSRRHAVARCFLTKYAAASPYGLDLDSLRAIVATTTADFNGVVRRLKGAFRSLPYRHNMLHLHWFLRWMSREAFYHPNRHPSITGTRVY